MNIFIERSKWIRTCGSTWFTMGSGQIRLKFFYKFQYKSTRGERGWPINPYSDTHDVVLCNVGLFS